PALCAPAGAGRPRGAGAGASERPAAGCHGRRGSAATALPEDGAREDPPGQRRGLRAQRPRSQRGGGGARLGGGRRPGQVPVPEEPLRRRVPVLLAPPGGGAAVVCAAAGACAGGQPGGRAAAGGCATRSPRAAASPARQRQASPRGDALKAAVREAVRLELADFFGRRGELLPRSGRSKSTATGSMSPRWATHEQGPSRLEPDTSSRWAPAACAEMSSLRSEASDTDHEHDHFKTFVQQVAPATHTTDSLALRLAAKASRGPCGHQRLFRFFKWLWELHEPPRSGRLAQFVGSDFFERGVQSVIVLNCIVMLFAANDEMANYERPNPTLKHIGDAFQMFYMVEICLKLCVHRLYFFWNQDAGYNSFDFFLVACGLLDLVVSSGGSGSLALRAARLLKMAKSLRAVRVISKFRNLRAILLCIQGSFLTLMWSVLMLCVVFYMFSLTFVEQAASLRKDLLGQDLEDERQARIDYLFTNFGDVFRGMLTLAMAALGGEDWGTPYRSIEECGFLAAFCYLMFISFTQIALIKARRRVSSPEFLWNPRCRIWRLGRRRWRGSCSWRRRGT
ncbi:unnamed protein product, partial [Prorocentrum cordatum]